MRVLLSTSGSRGDVEPLVALAVRLRELGAEVRMCAPPASAERIADFGVPLVPVGRPERVMFKDGGPPPSPEDQRRFAAGAIGMQFDRLPAAVEGCDAVVTTGEMAAAVCARSVAEKFGIPYCYAAYSPVYLPSRHYRPPLDERTDSNVSDNQVLWEQRHQRFATRFGDPLNTRRAAIGLPPVRRFFDFGYTDRPWLAADPVLAPLQPDVAAVQTGAWLLPDERPLSPELEAFLDAGAPPVYVGFGSSSGVGDAASMAVAAIRARGCRVILSRGWAEVDLPDGGADCLAVGEVNFPALFGRVAAVVHHGGAGTTHVAARAGVPQVVLPQYTDQPYFADRVAELGIGVALDGPTRTVESLSAALDTALGLAVRTRAGALARSIRTDGALVAARLLLDTVSGEQPAVLRALT